MEWLGASIAAITREKAGILRENGTLITLPQHPEANQVLGEVAAELNVQGVSAAAYMPQRDMSQRALAGSAGPYEIEALGETIQVDSPLRGAHQHRNIALAIAAAVELATHHGFRIRASDIAEGLRTTVWPARLERIHKDGVEWILDVAHNPAGAWALRAGLSAALAEDKRHTLIFSCLRDKPLTEMAQILFPLFDLVIVAPIHAARAAAMEDLLAAAAATGTRAVTADSVGQAMEFAKNQVIDNIVVISGSVYLVGEARTFLLDEGGSGLNERVVP
jgi:dihydrofolate synthase/folylpolyglutamate synthase